MGVRKSNDGRVLKGLVMGVTVGAAVMILVAFFAGAMGAGMPQFADSILPPPASSQAVAATPLAAKVPPALESVLEAHLSSLDGQARAQVDQGILVETLDGDVLMAHNTSCPINPGSVLKLAPTLMALETFGPDHRFRTAAVAGGEVATGVLDGPLGIRCDGDPDFTKQQAADLASKIHAAGIREVTGDFVVAGPLSFWITEETPAAAQRLREAITRSGIKIAGVTRTASEVSGTEVAAVESLPLLEIVRRQNAYSDNRLADNLGTTVGGPDAVRRYLIEKVGAPAAEVTVGHTSGLGHNALSARAAMLLLRALWKSAESHKLSLDQIIPLNGVDSGTMRTRMVSDGLAGSIAAKTGTHYSEDGGVAALAGVAYTREKGAVLFVILNSNGPVRPYRKWQDELLVDAVGSLGGSRPLARVDDITARDAAGYKPDDEGKDPFKTAD